MPGPSRDIRANPTGSASHGKRRGGTLLGVGSPALAPSRSGCLSGPRLGTEKTLSGLPPCCSRAHWPARRPPPAPSTSRRVSRRRPARSRSPPRRLRRRDLVGRKNPTRESLSSAERAAPPRSHSMCPRASSCHLQSLHPAGRGGEAALLQPKALQHRDEEVREGVVLLAVERQ